MTTCSRADAGAWTNYPFLTQKERDNETGLDYLLHRNYSSAQGRFTSVDPTLKSANGINPQTWNRYVYVLNNPLQFVDPLGLWIVSFRQVLDKDGKFDRYEIYLEKSKKGDDAASLVKQLGFDSTKGQGKKLLEQISKSLGKGDEIRGAKLSGIVGRVFNAAETGLTGQVKYDIAHPNNRTASQPRGPDNPQYADCSMTSCRIAFPGQMFDATQTNFGVDQADEMLRGRDIKDNSLQVGDIIRYAAGRSRHFANVFFKDDDGVTQVFSRTGVRGVFETLDVNDPKLTGGYGPITGRLRP